MQFTTLFSVLFLVFGFFAGRISAFPLWSRGALQARADDLSLGKPATGYRSSVYFINWGIYARNFHVQDLAASANRITHVHYAFANINTTTGEVYLSDLWADIQKTYPTDNPSENGTNIYGSIKQLNLLKKKNRKLKVLLAIGGQSYSPNFAPACSTDAARKNFAKTAVALVRDLGFDGLDIDWEYPSGSTQVNNFVLLLRAVRAQLNAYATQYQVPKPLLTIATSPSPSTYQTAYDFPNLNPILDFISLMAYDYSGSWSAATAHHANLNPNARTPAATPLNTNAALTYYLNTGKVTASKILLGMPLYGRSFDKTKGMGQAFSGVGGGSWENGVWDFKDLPRPGAVESVDEQVGGAWCLGGGLLVSYDTLRVAELKGGVITSKGLGGGMWWEASGDKKGAASLVGKVTDTIGGSGLGRLDQSTNNLNYPGSKYDNVRKGFPGE